MSRVLLIAVAAFVLVGFLSPPLTAGGSLEQRKVQLLELLGLDGADPTVVQAAQKAHTLYSVDIVPGAESVSVILQLSGLPAYDSYLYKENRRLVVDLRDTINLSPSPAYSFKQDDPIKEVRNSQYRVSPTLISRIVLDLDEDKTPAITSDGNNIIISTPLDDPEKREENVKAYFPKEEAPAQIVAVPAVKVNADSPKVDLMLAQVEPTEPAPVEAPVEDSAPSLEMAEPVNEAAPEVQEVDEIGEILAATAAEEAPLDEMIEEEAVEEVAAAPDAVETETATAEVVTENEPAVQEVEEPATAEVSVEPKDQIVEVPVEKIEQPVLEAKLVAETETAPAVAKEPEAVKMNNLVTLNFRDADLSAVLDILARKGNLNILAGKDVRGNVTVRLVDVPFDVALNAVLNVNGYGYIKTDNIVRVVPLSQLGTQVETRTETYTLSYAEAKQAKTTFQTLLSPNGKIEVDERTNMLLITDVPSNLDRLRELIPQIDRRVQQVLIEVLILDSVLSDEADLGITWYLTNTNDNSPGFDGNDIAGVLLPKPFGGLDISVGTLIDDINLSVMIQALVENSDSRILANPKVLTLNNESASIEIIEEFPYNDVTQTSSGGQLSNITFKEIGTKLEVLPQITHDGYVILRVEPEQNSIAGTTITGVPIVDTRRAETTLIVRDHQTVVLGGLRENRKLLSVSKVPFLGDLPGVKYAFRNVGSSDRDTELLVFLTVHIVESPPLIPSQEIKFDELANLPRKPSVSIDLIR